jgi:hypothetical protein
MKVKTLFLIFFSGFIFSNNYSNIGDITKAEFAYYENNKWDFIENELVNKVHCSVNNDDIAALTFAEVLSGLFWLSSEMFSKNDKAFIFLGRGFFVFFSLIYTIALLSNKSFKEKLKIECLLSLMDDFFKNYSIEQKSNLQINNRKFIPQELLSTFDAIYDSHKKEGADSLKSYVNIFEMIRKKFIVPVKVK